MSLSRQQILESIPTEFDYFESKQIQAAIVNEFDRWYQPSSLQPGAPIEFDVKGSDDLFLDLNSSKLEVKCKITNADGSDIANDAPVGPVDLALSSLFQSIEMDICGKTISSQNTLQPYRAFMEKKLSFDSQICKTRLLAEGWMNDTPGHMDDFRLGDPGHNDGFKKRVHQWRGSRTVTLIGRPHVDLFHQNLNIPPSCSIRMRFLPVQQDFFIKRSEADRDHHYRYEIQSARLWVRTKQVSPNFLLAQETMLRRENARIPFTKVEMKTATIPNGLSAISLDNLYTGTLPERVSVLFIGDNRINGHTGRNPFAFEHFNLSHVAMLVNGEQLPRVAYQPDFEHGDYLREYLGMLEGLGLDTGNRSIALTPNDWAENFPVFIFRLTPGGLPSIPKTGSVRLDLKFSQPTPRNIIALFYSEVPTLLEIDKDRNATIA